MTYKLIMQLKFKGVISIQEFKKKINKIRRIKQIKIKAKKMNLKMIQKKKINKLLKKIKSTNN